MLSIKVLGPGCANCHKLEGTVKQAVAMLNIPAAVEKVTEYPDIMRYNILSTPGLVINEKLVSAGRLPALGEVTTWLTDALEE